ncbi:hypothetical protein ACROYT_G014994 [Oculina patagonica]
MAEPAGELPPLAAEPPAISEPAAEPVAEPVLEPVAQPAAPNQGVIKVYGKVGVCSPPHLVLPLTVEPSKPRLSHDERFLNLWVRDLPFKLDHLPDLPRYVFPGHFQTTFDDKNGYQHLKIHPDSQEFFSFSWRGYYFSFCTLPFGWKASAFLYHNTGLVVTSAARSLGVPLSQYIDDRHVGQLFLSGLVDCQPSRQLAQAAAFILLFLLISAGYFVNLAKSSPEPSTFVRFLGFISDSIVQAFFIPPDKKEKFRALREELLGSSCAPVKSLQRFAGKALSFSLAIPACRLYVREVFKAIAVVAKNSKISVPIQGPLRQELQEWTFLDNWSGHLPWRSEHHLSVTMFSDASQRAWGAVLVKDGLSQQIRDYWTDLEDDINVLEARALCNALSSLFPSIKNTRIDIERSWKPAFRCSACCYPNDSDANFCQACGNPTSREPTQGARPNVDMPLINKRFAEFRESFRNRPYERQKDSLEIQLSSFLRSLVPPKKVSAASAEDIVKFLVSKDTAGKQKIHVRSCSRKTCDCPKRLAAGTVDSYIGKLRAIFNKLGRTGFSNPLAHPCVKEYLKFVREEQAQQPLQPRQAVPLFYDKFTRLITYLRGLIVEGSELSPLNKYLLVRDVTFFVVDFYTGDRASDLGRLKADQLFRLKDREGFLLNFTFSKTRRAGQLRPFALLRIPNVPACPVFWLNYYIAACGSLGVPLLGEYFFRSSEHKKFISHRPFGGSAVSARLHKYLKAAGIDDGETPHSFRVGISYTLKGLGCTPEQIAQYVGWRSTEMALYYTRHSNVSTSLQLLERVTFNLTSKGSQPAPDLSDQGNLQRIL